MTEYDAVDPDVVCEFCGDFTATVKCTVCSAELLCESCDAMCHAHPDCLGHIRSFINPGEPFLSTDRDGFVGSEYEEITHLGPLAEIDTTCNAILGECSKCSGELTFANQVQLVSCNCTLCSDCFDLGVVQTLIFRCQDAFDVKCPACTGSILSSEAIHSPGYVKWLAENVSASSMCALSSFNKTAALSHIGFLVEQQKALGSRPKKLQMDFDNNVHEDVQALQSEQSNHPTEVSPETLPNAKQGECHICCELRPLLRMPVCTCNVCAECICVYVAVMLHNNEDKGPAKLTCPVCKLPDAQSIADPACQYYSQLRSLLSEAALKPELLQLFDGLLGDWMLEESSNRFQCSWCLAEFKVSEYFDRQIRCPSCSKDTCRLCNQSWFEEHRGIGCEQFTVWLAKKREREQREQKELAEFISSRCIKCPKCGFQFELSRGGCLQLECHRCSEEFCSDCLKQFVHGGCCPNKGLHCHHGDDCIDNYRDLPIDKVCDLAAERGISLNFAGDRNVSPGAFSSGCVVVELKDTPGGKRVDSPCGQYVCAGGVCKKHLIEAYVRAMRVEKDDDDVEHKQHTYWRCKHCTFINKTRSLGSATFLTCNVCETICEAKLAQTVINDDLSSDKPLPTYANEEGDPSAHKPKRRLQQDSHTIHAVTSALTSNTSSPTSEESVSQISSPAQSQQQLPEVFPVDPVVADRVNTEATSNAPEPVDASDGSITEYTNLAQISPVDQSQPYQNEPVPPQRPLRIAFTKPPLVPPRISVKPTLPNNAVGPDLLLQHSNASSLGHSSLDANESVIQHTSEPKGSQTTVEDSRSSTIESLPYPPVESIVAPENHLGGSDDTPPPFVAESFIAPSFLSAEFPTPLAELLEATKSPITPPPEVPKHPPAPPPEVPRHTSATGPDVPQHPSKKVPEVPKHPSTKVPEVPKHPSTKVPEVPKHPSTKVPEVPKHPSTKVPEVPKHPSTKVPEVPKHPSTKVPEVPKHPSEKVPLVPNHPTAQTPEAPKSPSAQPSQSRFARLYPVIPSSESAATTSSASPQLSSTMPKKTAPQLVKGTRLSLALPSKPAQGTLQIPAAPAEEPPVYEEMVNHQSVYQQAKTEQELQADEASQREKRRGLPGLGRLSRSIQDLRLGRNKAEDAGKSPQCKVS